MQKKLKNILRTCNEATTSTASFASLLAQSTFAPVPMETANSSQERVEKNKQAYSETGTPDVPKKRGRTKKE